MFIRKGKNVGIEAKHAKNSTAENKVSKLFVSMLFPFIDCSMLN